MSKRRNREPRAGSSQEPVEPAEVEESTAGAADEVTETKPAEPAEVAAPHPQGWVKCLAIQTCGVRGMPAYAGETFWLEPESAVRLEGKGHLKIL